MTKTIEEDLLLKLRMCPCGNDRYARRYCEECETLLKRLDEVRSQPVLTTGDVMLREIIASPHDKALRSIFSDHLEDSGGEVWWWRAELIRSEERIRYAKRRNEFMVCESSTTVTPRLCASGRLLLMKGSEWHLEGCDEVEYRHGFIEVIKAPFDVLCRSLTKWVTEYPLTAVEVSDREPMRHYTTDIESFSWTHSSRFHMRCRIPYSMWKETLKRQTMLSDDVWAAFNTPEEAIKALSDTLLDMARRRTL